MVNSILAAILSFFIPGTGQAYAGHVKRGAIFFILSLAVLIIVFLRFRHLIYYTVDFLISIYAAYDAYKIVKKS